MKKIAVLSLLVCLIPLFSQMYDPDLIHLGSSDTFFVATESPCSVWFNDLYLTEETNCDGMNIVEICYDFSTTCTEEFYEISIALSSDSGITWDVPLITLSDAELDTGMVISGLHCFNWLMSDDLRDFEGCDFIVEAKVRSLWVNSIYMMDSLDYIYSGTRAGGGGIACHGDLMWTGKDAWGDVDTVFTIRMPGEEYIDTFTYSGFFALEDMAFGDGDLFLSGAWKVFKIDTADGSKIDSIQVAHAAGQLVQGVAFDGDYVWASRRDFWFFKIDPSDMSAVDSFELDYTGTGFPEGLTYANGYLWGLIEDHGFLLQISPVDGSIVNSLTLPYVPSSSNVEGLGWDGETFWYAELGPEDRIYQIGVEYPTDIDTSDATCLDSRSPVVNFDCSSIVRGESSNMFNWNITDMFVTSPICSLYFDYGWGLDFYSVEDTVFSWDAPAICDSVIVRIAARDSFCNYGEISCVLDVCNPMSVDLECPPVYSVSSCSTQTVTYAVTDTLCGTGLNDAFFTVKVFSSIDDSTVYSYNDTSSSELSFVSGGMGVTRIILENIPYSDSDSIVVSLDSLINSMNCITIPTE